MTAPPQPLAPTATEFLVYAGDDGAARVQVRLAEGTVWLTQRLMAELYGVSVPTINEHLTSVYDTDELEPGATIRKFRIVQSDGNRSVSRLVDHYGLPAILAVGYRIRSPQGTRFRQWATERRPTTMADWAAKLDSFLEFNERNVLSHVGKVSHELAVAHAESEFERFEIDRRRLEAAQPTSDFDRMVEGAKQLEAQRQPKKPAPSPKPKKP